MTTRQRLGNRKMRSALNRSEWKRCRTPSHGLRPMTLGHRECGGYGTLRSLSVSRYGQYTRGRVPVWMGNEWLFKGMRGTILRQSRRGRVRLDRIGEIGCYARRVVRWGLPWGRWLHDARHKPGTAFGAYITSSVRVRVARVRIP